jgi:hypothetical protein
MKTKIIKIGIIAFITVMAAISAGAQTATQDAAKPEKQVKTCKGITKAGNPCKSTFVVKGTDFCNSHQQNAIKCAGKNAKGEKCGNSVKVAGAYCRFHEPK